MSDDPFTYDRFNFVHRGRRYRNLRIDCVPTVVERIVPPAGETYAWDYQHHRRSVEITISPTGRSIRIFVDGKEVV